MRSQLWVRWGLLAGLTAAGTVAMAALGVPSPALFAGLLVATALALAGLAPARIPRSATAAAQAVIGVVIGVLAQPGTLAGLAADWLPVLLVISGTLAISMAGGLLMGLWPGITPLTGMLALTAGGASGLVAVSRELGGDDRVVAVVQYLRVGIVTATMPVVAAVVFGASVTSAVNETSAGAPWFVDLGFLLFCAVAGTAIARLLRVPSAALLGPMTLAIVLNLAGWSFGATPPTLIVEVAYAVIGWQAGARFTRESLRTVLGLLPLATALILAVIAACAGLGMLLSTLTGATALEGYLATTPGGVYAVLATAISAGVDVTFVVAVQVLRVIVMLLVAPVLARLVRHRGGGEAAAAQPP
ncbi:AbrB family transcriptional regulator [Pseudonocardia aurantiaca]|uniref:AbrB family transcriptional regulator n=1 Tax=Pseudonocardia aurantiaca TaxID=75290 RepID=A0ABW4FGW1_9PSEU